MQSPSYQIILRDDFPLESCSGSQNCADLKMGPVSITIAQGKPLSEAERYRPISLLSSIGKLVQWMVQQPLQHWLKSTRKMNPNHVGYPRGQAIVEQLTRVVQTVVDGFENKKAHRAVLVLLDYAKAYDRVWRGALLAKMVRLGIPSCDTH